MINQIKISEFNRHVLVVMAGTVLSQALPVLASPLLTRIFTTSQFGVFTLYFATSNIFSLIATLRYEMAIILPDNKNDAYNVFGLSLFISSTMTIVSFLILLLLKSPLTYWFHHSEVVNYFLLIPASLFFTGLFNSGYYWLLRNKSFKRISIARFFQNFIWVFTSITLGLYGFKTIGLICGLIAGQIVSALLVIFWMYKEEVNSGLSFNRNKMFALASYYKNFPRLNTLHAFVDSLQLNGITYLLSLFYGNQILGLYAIAYRTLRAPLAMIGASMSPVLYQKFSEAYNKQTVIKPMVLNSLRTLFLIGIIPFGILLFAAPWMFKIIFGSEWTTAGVYAQILVPWLFLNFLLSPVSQLPNVLKRQGKYFFLTLSANIFAFLALMIVSQNYRNADYALLAYSIVMSVFTIIIIIWNYNLAKNHDKIMEQNISDGS